MKSGGMQASCMGWVDSHGDPSQAAPAAQRLWLGGGGEGMSQAFSGNLLCPPLARCSSDLSFMLRMLHRLPLSDSVRNRLFAPAGLPLHTPQPDSRF